MIHMIYVLIIYVFLLRINFYLFCFVDTDATEWEPIRDRKLSNKCYQGKWTVYLLCCV